MRFANYDGQLTLIVGDPDELEGTTGIDVHAASGGRIPADPDLALQVWAEVMASAPELTSADQTTIIKANAGAAPRRRTRGESG